MQPEPMQQPAEAAQQLSAAQMRAMLAESQHELVQYMQQQQQQFEQRLAQQHQQHQEAMEARLDTIKHVVQARTDRLAQELRHEQQQQREETLQRFKQVELTLNSTQQQQQPAPADGAALAWELETARDQPAQQQAAPCLVVQPTQQQQQQSPAVEAVATQVGVPTASVQPHPRVRSACLVNMGAPQAAQSKLRALRGAGGGPARAGPFVVRRERTGLGVARARVLGAVGAAVRREISKGGYGELQVFTAANAAHLLLTRGSVQDALSNRAFSARYPVWVHVPFQPAGAGGQGRFGLDPRTLIHMDADTVSHHLQLAASNLPPSAPPAQAAAPSPHMSAPEASPSKGPPPKASRPGGNSTNM